jgi:hypothetical protein
MTAMPGEVERGARCNRPDDREKRSWQPRCKPAEEKDDRHHRRREAKRRHIQLR